MASACFAGHSHVELNVVAGVVGDSLCASLLPVSVVASR